MTQSSPADILCAPMTADDVNRVIDTPVAYMNVGVRRTMRPRLRKTNKAYGRVVIGRGGTMMSVKFDDRAPMESPANHNFF